MWRVGDVIVHPSSGGDIIRREAFYAVQQAIGSTESFVRWYGSATRRRTLNFVMFERENGDAGRATLEDYLANGTAVELIAASVSQGDYRIMSLSLERLQALNESSPVYRGSLEMIQVV